MSFQLMRKIFENLMPQNEKSGQKKRCPYSHPSTAPLRALDVCKQGHQHNVLALNKATSIKISGFYSERLLKVKKTYL